MSYLFLVLSVLSAVCPCLVLAASDTARVTILSSTNTIQGAVSWPLSKYQAQSVLEYNAVSPSTSISLSYSTNTDVIAAMTNASIDFALITTALSATQSATFGLLDVVQYPVAALPLVIVYNMPPFGTCSNSATNCPPLVLSRTALCNLFLGNITKWNDPQVTVTNPSGTTSNAVKVIVANDPDYAETEILTRFCSKVDTTGSFQSYIGYGSVVNWNSNRTTNATIASASATADSTVAAIAQLVDATPYSVSYMSWSAALNLGLPFAQIKNKYGSTVLLNMSALAAATAELASSNMNPSYLDLTDAQGPAAYPLVGPVYLLMYKLFTRYTCTMRQQLQGYVLWMLKDTTASLAAADQSLLVLSPASQLGTALFTRMQGDLYCNNGPVYVPPRPSFVGTGSFTASFINVSVARFADVDAAYAYNTMGTGSWNSTLALQKSRVDLALVNPTDWNFTLAGNNSLTAQYAASVNLTLLPALVATTVPIFSLPPAVVATERNANYSTPLFPLAIGVDTLANVILGRITSWLHPSIVLFNPSLPARFTDSGASTHISVIVCCRQPDENFTTTNAFNTMMTLASPVYAAGPFNPPVPITTTLVWNKLINLTVANAALNYTSNGASYIVAYNEGRLRNTVAANPGSIGYASLTSPAVSDRDTFRLISHSQMPVASQTAASSASAAASVAAGAPAASWQSLAACVTPTSLNVIASTLDVLDSSVPSSCWPLAFLISAAIPTIYYPYGVLGQFSGQVSDRCIRGMDSLSLLSFLTTDSSLSELAQLKGLARIADSANIGVNFTAAVQSALLGVSCNGVPLMGAPQSDWVMASAMYITGLCVAGFGMVCCSVSVVMLLIYRNHSFLKSSSATLLALAVLGWLLLFVSAVLLLTDPSDAVCSALMWILSVGWTLTFCPLVLRAWRVWRIFQSSNKLEVVRIRSSSLVIAVTGLLAIDLATLAAWQQDGPLAPTLYMQPDLLFSSSSALVSHTHCSVTSVSGGMSAQIALKCAVLLVALHFCQCTAECNNNAYSEGQSVASLVSSSCLILAIVIPAMYVTSAVGYGLIFLLLVPLLVIPLIGISFILLPKWTAAYHYWRVGEDSAASAVDKERARLAAHINQLTRQLDQANKALRYTAENSTAQQLLVRNTTNQSPTKTTNDSSRAMEKRNKVAAEGITGNRGRMDTRERAMK